MVTKKSKNRSDITALNASELREFKKTNDAIGLRVVEGNLTLLSRKVFNVMMYHAQEAKIPGQNAPDDKPASKKYFWIPLADLARDAAYNSRDVDHLKNILKEMQDIRLVLETDRQWTSERLVSSVTLVNPSGFNKHGGQVWFGYAFPPEVHEQVMSPSTYTRLSMIYQSSLKSGSALGLYEICRRFATNPSKMTFVQPLEYWYGAVTGNPPSDNGLPPYKYFKRDTLKPAIAEINALTDIQIELIEHKNGRSISALQFRVESASQPQLEFPAPPVLDSELIERIMKFGFNHADASNCLGQHTDAVLRLAISRVEARVQSKSHVPLESPAGYFRWVLKDIVKEPSKTALTASKNGSSKKEKSLSLLERFSIARAQDALEAYKELNHKERNTIFDLFKQQNPNSPLNLDKGIEAASVRSLFSSWYAQHLWGEPTVDAVSAYSENESDLIS